MTEATIRWKWLNGMYVYTAVGAGSLGVAMLLAPQLVVAYLQMPIQDPMVFGIVGSAYLAFAMAAILGLRFPLRCVPVLMLQLIYKSVWLVAVFLPTLISGTPAAYAWVLAAISLSYVVGDCIAIPFRQLLAQESMKV